MHQTSSSNQKQGALSAKVGDAGFFRWMFTGIFFGTLDLLRGFVFFFELFLRHLKERKQGVGVGLEYIASDSRQYSKLLQQAQKRYKIRDQLLKKILKFSFICLGCSVGALLLLHWILPFTWSTFWKILSWCLSLVSDVLPDSSLMPPAPLAVANFWLYVLSVVPPAMMALEVFYMWTSRIFVNLVLVFLPQDITELVSQFLEMRDKVHARPQTSSAGTLVSGTFERIKRSFADVLYSLLFQFVFIVFQTPLSCLLHFSIPVEMCFAIHTSIFYALGAFENIWFASDVYVNERLQRVDRNWPYFLGFGLPIYLFAVPTTRRLMQLLMLPTAVEAPIAYFLSSVVFPLAILAAASSDRERRWQLKVGAKSGRSLVLFVPSTVVSDAFVMRILPLFSVGSPRASATVRPAPAASQATPAASPFASFAPLDPNAAADGMPKARKRN